MGPRGAGALALPMRQNPRELAKPRCPPRPESRAARVDSHHGGNARALNTQNVPRTDSQLPVRTE